MEKTLDCKCYRLKSDGWDWATGDECRCGNERFSFINLKGHTDFDFINEIPEEQSKEEKAISEWEKKFNKKGG